MAKIIKLHEKITEIAKSAIIDNLKNIHHGKPVHAWCATRGISDSEVGFDALNVLVSENIVKKRHISVTDKHGQKIYMPVYQYNSFIELK